MAEKKTLIAVLGATAVGKTSMAIEIAKALETEIVSFDSRQFFKELNIGTAKPSANELNEVKHHFIDHLSISEEYNASKFEKEALQFLEPFFKEKDQVVFCGGSGMYIDAVTSGFDEQLPSADENIRAELNLQLEEHGITVLQEQLKALDPEFYQKIDLQNSKRLLRAIEVCLITKKPYSHFRKGLKKTRPFEIIKIGLEMEREQLYERINIRVDQMIKDGLLEEVKALTNFKDKNALKTVGYQELFNYLKGEWDLNFAIEKIKINSRRYAKRQLTWFKKDPEIEWFHPSDKIQIIEYLRKRI